MHIFVINGSPKGPGSNTYRLTQAFLDGLRQDTPLELRESAVNRLNLRPCLGCFSCWNKTPGTCCIQDDMSEIIENMLWADVIIWSFPLYYFSVPGSLKNLIDRQLPMVLPFMQSDAEYGSHPTRYDLSGKRHVVISTCGFYTAQGNYDGVTAIFDHLCGEGNYTAILCGQGELFRVRELHTRTDEYLSFVTQAGREYCGAGISRETREKLSQLLYPRETFEAMADASWGVEKNGEASDETLTFTRQMAALYNPKAHTGKDQVLEMYYTDTGKRYQILMTKEGSKVLTENFRDYTTRIETPYTVWLAIATGEISGEEAMMQQKYRVKGDFDLMLHWDDYFGSATEKKEPAPTLPQKPTNMNILLFPWIVYWVFAAIDPFFGALISIAGCAVVPVLYFRNKKTIYDQLSGVFVTGFAIALLLGISQRILVPLSYFAFGLMWTVSCFLKVPLTAHYSMNDYNGEKALKNPLFIKTNWILTLCWGVLYLFTPSWTYILTGTALGSWVGAVNSILPMLMGVFTAWFQKWYPAKVARGN